MNHRPSSSIDLGPLALAIGFLCFPGSVAGDVPDPPSHAAFVDAVILDAVDSFLADHPVPAVEVDLCVDEDTPHAGLVSRLVTESLTALGHRVRGGEECGTLPDSSTGLTLAVGELELRTRREGRSLLGGVRVERECRVTLAIGLVEGGMVTHQERRSAQRSDEVKESALPGLEGGVVRPVHLDSGSPWILEPIIALATSAGMFYLFFTSRDDE